MNSCVASVMILRPAGLDAVILVFEGDAALVGCDQARVGDGHPVGVAGRDRRAPLRPGKGSFGIDDPVLRRSGLSAAAKAAAACERGVAALKDEAPLLVRRDQHVEHRDAGTAATARGPAGRSPAGRRSSAGHRARARRPARSYAHADDASWPSPRCAAPT